MYAMKMHKRSVVTSLAAALCVCASVAAGEVRSPTLWADVPDVSMCRKGGKYFMVSTTMHFNPGIPVMVSQDLVNWKMASYCYQTVENRPCDRLENGENDYAFGTFASSIRYNESDGYFYVISVNVRIDDTYLFRTKDPEKGGWEFHRLKKNQYDASIWIEDGRFWVFATMPGKPYKVRLTEMKPDFSGFVDDGMITLDNVTDCVGGEGLGEGAQVMKRNGWYYIVNICWPAGNCRTVVVHRSRSMQGPWEGRVVFQHAGIAQGSFIDTPDGKWYAYLFGDRGAVGRCPYILPMTWSDDWPVISEESLPHPSGRPGIVSADDFASESLSLVWQWNHNPADGLWSLTDRRGASQDRQGRRRSALRAQHADAALLGSDMLRCGENRHQRTCQRGQRRNRAFPARLRFAFGDEGERHVVPRPPPGGGRKCGRGCARPGLALREDRMGACLRRLLARTRKGQAVEFPRARRRVVRVFHGRQVVDAHRRQVPP